MNQPVADPGIDKRGGGAPIFERIYTHHSCHSYVLEGSGCMLPLKILKTKALNYAFKTIFRPKFGRFFVFGTLNGEEGRRRLRSPLDLPLSTSKQHSFNVFCSLKNVSITCNYRVESMPGTVVM